jgi:hypothetical protein
MHCVLKSLTISRPHGRRQRRPECEGFTPKHSFARSSGKWPRGGHACAIRTRSGRVVVVAVNLSSFSGVEDVSSGKYATPVERNLNVTSLRPRGLRSTYLPFSQRSRGLHAAKLSECLRRFVAMRSAVPFPGQYPLSFGTECFLQEVIPRYVKCTNSATTNFTA